MIVCEQLNRNAYLMELDEKFVDVIVKRYLKLVNNSNDCYLIRNNANIPLNTIKDFNNDS